MKPRKVVSLGLILSLVAATGAPLLGQQPKPGQVEGAARGAVSSNRAKAKQATPSKTTPKKATTRRATGPGRGPGVSTAAKASVRGGGHPRQRNYRGVVVVRSRGGWYHGYGHHQNDSSAWKWLAFTAITIKLLDNLNEAQQRQHETAQIEATTAEVGQPVAWQEGTASGSVTTTSESQNAAGEYCREFQQEITVGGETEQAFGTACLQPDGAWKIVSD